MRPFTLRMGGEKICFDRMIKLEGGKSEYGYFIRCQYLSEYFLSKKDRRPIFWRRNHYDTEKEMRHDLNKLLPRFEDNRLILDWQTRHDGIKYADFNGGFIIDRPDSDGWYYVYPDEIKAA